MTTDFVHTDFVNTDADAVKNWVKGYRRAWESNHADDIRAIFTEDAVYRGTPSGDAWVGHPAIVSGWLEHQDPPGTTSFEWQPVAVQGDVAVVQCVTTYREGPNAGIYDNLWVIRLTGDGRASEFTDWYVARE